MPKIKKGTICTLTKNPNIVFRLCGKNYNLDYPYADIIMFRGEITQTGGRTCVAYTNLWEEATPEQKEQFISKVHKCNPDIKI